MLSTQRPVTRVGELVAAGMVEPAEAPAMARVVETFQLRITPEMAALIDPAAPEGAVARQFVPSTAELEIAEDELEDPIGDEPMSPVEGLIHRYPDRVLLKPTHLCQVYCRFCFRRETVGDGAATLDPEAIAAALDHIRRDTGIFEVILSGGDPLVLSDRRLGALLDALEAIDHVRVVRFHTRVPVVDPTRIDAALTTLLDRRFAVWIVVHVNAVEEIGAEAEAAFRHLSRAGVPLLSQTVLLKGVNDEATKLEALFRALVANRVKPYYLHHLDRARGTGHFRTSIAEGRDLMRRLRGSLTGIAQPTYVLDIPGGHGKVPIGPDYIEASAPGHYRVTDPNGTTHDYRDAAEPAPAVPAKP